MKKLSENNYRDKIRQLILNNKKIEAIKYLRSLTGLGLKESKELIECFSEDLSQINNLKIESSVEEVVSEDEYQDTELNEERLYKKIEELIEKGQKLQAVKFAKEVFNIGLKEAKEMVESLQEKPKSETFVFGEDESQTAELKIEEESPIVFEKIEELKAEIEKKTAPKKKNNKKRTSPKDYNPVTFGKSTKRDRKKKKARTNSGCMLMLTFIFFTGLLIGGGIYLL